MQAVFALLREQLEAELSRQIHPPAEDADGPDTAPDAASSAAASSDYPDTASDAASSAAASADGTDNAPTADAPEAGRADTDRSDAVQNYAGAKPGAPAKRVANLANGAPVDPIKPNDASTSAEPGIIYAADTRLSADAPPADNLSISDKTDPSSATDDAAGASITMDALHEQNAVFVRMIFQRIESAVLAAESASIARCSALARENEKLRLQLEALRAMSLFSAAPPVTDSAAGTASAAPAYAEDAGDALSEMQDMLRRELMNTSPDVVCHECGADNAPGTEFCGDCAARLFSAYSFDDDTTTGDNIRQHGASRAGESMGTATAGMPVAAAAPPSQFSAAEEDHRVLRGLSLMNSMFPQSMNHVDYTAGASSSSSNNNNNNNNNSNRGRNTPAAASRYSRKPAVQLKSVSDFSRELAEELDFSTEVLAPVPELERSQEQVAFRSTNPGIYSSAPIPIQPQQSRSRGGSESRAGEGLRGLSLLGQFLGPPPQKPTGRSDSLELEGLLGRAMIGGAISVNTPRPATRSVLTRTGHPHASSSNGVNSSLLSKERGSSDIGGVVNPASIHSSTGSKKSDTTPKTTDNGHDDQQASQQLHAGILAAVAAGNSKENTVKEGDPVAASEEEAEPMDIEVEVAATFQRIAGLYDSTPRDFAREMRQNSRDATAAVVDTPGNSDDATIADASPTIKTVGQASASLAGLGVRKSPDTAVAGASGPAAGGGDIYATQAPVGPRSGGYFGSAPPPPKNRTLEEVQSDFRWKQFLAPKEDEDTDSDEDEEIVQRLDYNLKVQCQKVRALIREPNARVSVGVSTAKYKRRHFLGFRRWRYYVVTRILGPASPRGRSKRRRSPKHSEEKGGERGGVAVRRQHRHFVWIYKLLVKLYRKKRVTLSIGPPPKPSGSNKEQAARDMSEWVQQLQTIEKRGLHTKSEEWIMFLAASDREFEAYQKRQTEIHTEAVDTSAPSAAAAAAAVAVTGTGGPADAHFDIAELVDGIAESLSDARAVRLLSAIQSTQKDHLVGTHAWFGAAIGALDGVYEHGQVGSALGSSSFRQDQVFGLEKPLRIALDAGGTDTENARVVLDAARGEVLRHQRIQVHWNRVATALSTAVALEEGPAQMLNAFRARGIHRAALEAEKAPSIEDAKETGHLTAPVRRNSSPSITAPSPTSKLVARLVPPHIIAGPHKPILGNGSHQISREVKLFSGHVATLGRDIGNDIQIKDAAASRKHGQIEVSMDHRVFFVDLGSSNGTEVDGIHISSHGRIQLRSGSRIRVGDTYFFCLMVAPDGGGTPRRNSFQEANSSISKSRRSSSQESVRGRSASSLAVVGRGSSGEGLVDGGGGGTLARAARPSMPENTSPRQSNSDADEEESDPFRQELKVFVLDLVAQGNGDYQSVRSSVAKRWGVSRFQKYRDFVRELIRSGVSQHAKGAGTQLTGLRSAGATAAPRTTSQAAGVGTKMQRKKTWTRATTSSTTKMSSHRPVVTLAAPADPVGALLSDLGVTPVQNDHAPAADPVQRAAPNPPARAPSTPQHHMCDSSDTLAL